METVEEDQVVASVVDIDAPALEAISHLAVIPEVIADDKCLAGVTGPNSANRITYDPIFDVTVAERKGVFDAVRGRIGEIIVDQQIVRVATPFVPCARVF